MTADETVRAAVFFFGVIVVGGCLAEIWYGPRRGMTWGQLFRYISLAIIMGTLMVFQYNSQHVPITGYTVAVFVGALTGSLGVMPLFRRPVRRK